MVLVALAAVAFTMPEQALADTNILRVNQSPDQSNSHDCSFAPMLLPF